MPPDLAAPAPRARLADRPGSAAAGSIELRDAPDPAAWPAGDAERLDEIARAIARLGGRLDAARGEPPQAGALRPHDADHRRPPPAGRPAPSPPATTPRPWAAARQAGATPSPAVGGEPLAREIRALAGSVEALGRTTAAGTAALRTDLAVFAGELRAALERPRRGQPADGTRRPLEFDATADDGLRREITALRQQLRRTRAGRRPAGAAPPSQVARAAPAASAATAPSPAPAPQADAAPPPAASHLPSAAAPPSTAAGTAAAPAPMHPAVAPPADAPAPTFPAPPPLPAASASAGVPADRDGPLTALAERVERLALRIDEIVRPADAPAEGALPRIAVPAAGAGPVTAAASRPAATAAGDPNTTATPSPAGQATPLWPTATAPAPTTRATAGAATTDAVGAAVPAAKPAASDAAASPQATGARPITEEIAACVRAEIAAGTERLVAAFVLATDGRIGEPTGRDEPHACPATAAIDRVAREVAGLGGRLAGIEASLVALRPVARAAPGAAEGSAAELSPLRRAAPAEAAHRQEAAPVEPPQVAAMPRSAARTGPERSARAVAPQHVEAVPPFAAPRPETPVRPAEPASVDGWTSALGPLSQRVRDEIGRLRGDAPTAAPAERPAGDDEPAGLSMRLIAAARRAGASATTAVPSAMADTAATEPVGAPAAPPADVAAPAAILRQRPPRAAPPRSTRPPAASDAAGGSALRRTLLLAAAAIALAAGSYGIARAPFRALVSYWHSTIGDDRNFAGDWRTDPLTTGSLPGGTAPPFGVTSADLGPAPPGGAGPAAAFRQAAALLDGQVGAGRAEEAAQLLLGAARAGLPQAQFRLGTLYERGTGVAQSRAEAVAWYELAAERGHVRAMHNLAVLTSEGPQDQRDYAKAAAWFRKAADRGLVDSQFNIAVLYSRGLGVRRDKAAAYLWFAVAAAAGDREAARRRAEIAREVPEKLLFEAERQAAAFAALTPDPLANDDSLVARAPLTPGGA